MLDLFGLTNSAIQSLNVNQSITWVQNTGYTTNAAGKRTPTTTNVTIAAQIQALSGEALRHAENLNLQGVMRSVYMYGNPQGVERVDSKGGDVLQFAEIPGGNLANWLVTSVVETWPTWAHVIVTLQNP